LKKPRTSQQKSQYELEYDENGEEIQRENNSQDQEMNGEVQPVIT